MGGKKGGPGRGGEGYCMWHHVFPKRSGLHFLPGEVRVLDRVSSALGLAVPGFSHTCRPSQLGAEKRSEKSDLSNVTEDSRAVSVEREARSNGARPALKESRERGDP